MSKLHELEDKAFGDAQLQRRQLIDTLEKEGFSRWDMSPEGHERFMKAKGEVLRTIKWDETANQYRVESADESPVEDDDPYTVQCTDNGFLGDVLPLVTPAPHGSSPIGSADAVDWRQRYFEARDALFQFKYPPDPKLLRDIAAEIDCGSDCAHGHTEWDTNAHVCSRSDSKEGCDGEKASCLRQFADAIDVRASLQREALGETPVE